MPKISVVMSVYNEPVEWMKQAIDSILNQTFSDFEFIIINDKPDRVENKQLLDEYASKDPRIVIITNEQNIGLTKSLNKGLLIAQGEYIARMDADDISFNDRFEKQVRLMDERPEVSVCGGWITLFGDKSGTLKYPKSNSTICLFIDSPFAHPSVMIRHCFLRDNSLLYNESCETSQDFDLWVTMFGLGAQFYNLQEPILKYRYSEIQIMKSKGQIQIATGRKIRHKALKLYFQKEGLDYQIPDEWTLEQMHLVQSHLSSYMNKEQNIRFIFYSFISFKQNALWKMIQLIFTGAIFKMQILDSLRVLCFSIQKRELERY